LFYVFKNKITQRFDSGIVASSARAWLAEHAGQRFVCMVHLYSTHTPYDPPAEWKREYCDPDYKGPVHSFYAQHREAIESGVYTPTPADVAQIQNLYFAGVAQADALIGSIVKELENAHVRRDTLVVVTADHGESLGEQNLWEHDHMVQTNLRVPLVMSWPGHLPSGVRVSAITDEIDVLPTICDLASIAAPQEPGERGKIDGVSLLPLVRGEKTAVREYSFAENGIELSVQDLRTKLVVPAEALRAESLERALADAAHATDAKPRLFDLASDPKEDHDVLAARRADAERLYKALRAWSESMPTPRSEIGVSERKMKEEQRRLKDLGYTDGVGANLGDGHNGSAGSGGAAPRDAKPK
jgi:arylsulfatase A-like enzyme